MKAKFITLEGGEGVGKSTNITFIKEFLEEHRKTVVVTREPGGTEMAEKIRNLLLNNHDEPFSDVTELLLIFAARAQHLKNVIQPALAQGHWVICDRFTDASYAYQGGGRGLKVSKIQQLESLVQGDFRPDLTLLLDAPVDIGIGRAALRGKLDRFESEKKVFFQQVRNAYLGLADQYPERIKVINADRKLSDIQKEIADILRTFL